LKIEFEVEAAVGALVVELEPGLGTFPMEYVFAG
jgi:hypothetical protein